MVNLPEAYCMELNQVRDEGVVKLVNNRWGVGSLAIGHKVDDDLVEFRLVVGYKTICVVERWVELGATSFLMNVTCILCFRDTILHHDCRRSIVLYYRDPGSLLPGSLIFQLHQERVEGFH